MECKLLVLYCGLFQVATAQYFSVPSSYPSYYSYYPSVTLTSPAYAPATAIPNLQNNLQTQKCPRCNSGNPANAFKKAESTYVLKTPLDKVKSSVASKEKDTKNLPQPVYSCPLCNNFADVKPNSKIPPPPPVGSPVLPGVIDKVPALDIPNNLTIIDPNSIFSFKTSVSDMCEKYKVPKKLSFDQELLEGFLTGLGITSK